MPVIDHETTWDATRLGNGKPYLLRRGLFNLDLVRHDTQSQRFDLGLGLFLRCAVGQHPGQALDLRNPPAIVFTIKINPEIHTATSGGSCEPHTADSTRFRLLPFPAHPVLGVFQHHPFGCELVADLVGTGEVALLLGLRAIGHKGLDRLIGEGQVRAHFGSDLLQPAGFFSPDQRAPRGLRIVIADHVEHRIEVGQHAQNRIPVAGQKLSAKGEMDALVVKLDAGGKPLWARGLGGAGPDLIQGIAVDGAGAITVTGMFSGSADFGGLERTARGPRDSFVARLGPDGNVRWAAQAGSETVDSYPDGNSWEYGFGLALDAAGNTFVAGKFVAEASFGPFSLTADPKYGYGIYIARLGPEGDFVAVGGAQRVGVPAVSAELVRPRRLALDDAGMLKLTGSLTKNGVRYAYLASAAPAALEQPWDFSAVPARAEGTAIAVRGTTVAIAGLLLGVATVGDDVLAASGGNDGLVAVLDASGKARHGYRAGGAGDDGANSMVIDKAGNLYIAGWFSSTASFGGNILTSAGDRDAFVWQIPLGEP